RAVAEDQADRYADLGPAGDQAAPAPAAPLHGQQHRAAPLTAHADALQDPHERQQDAAPDPDGGVAGNDADRGGGQAHDEQRRDQRRLAPDPVAQVTED